MKVVATAGVSGAEGGGGRRAKTSVASRSPASPGRNPGPRPVAGRCGREGRLVDADVDRDVGEDDGPGGAVAHDLDLIDARPGDRQRQIDRAAAERRLVDLAVGTRQVDARVIVPC